MHNYYSLSSQRGLLNTRDSFSFLTAFSPASFTNISDRHILPQTSSYSSKGSKTGNPAITLVQTCISYEQNCAWGTTSSIAPKFMATANVINKQHLQQSLDTLPDKLAMPCPLFQNRTTVKSPPGTQAGGITSATLPRILNVKRFLKRDTSAIFLHGAQCDVWCGGTYLGVCKTLPLLNTLQSTGILSQDWLIQR